MDVRFGSSFFSSAAFLIFILENMPPFAGLDDAVGGLLGFMLSI